MRDMATAKVNTRGRIHLNRVIWKLLLMVLFDGSALDWRVFWPHFGLRPCSRKSTENPPREFSTAEPMGCTMRLPAWLLLEDRFCEQTHGSHDLASVLLSDVSICSW